jgi:hypothetical protein
MLDVVSAAAAGSDDGKLQLIVRSLHRLNPGGALNLVGRGGDSRYRASRFHNLTPGYIRILRHLPDLSKGGRVPPLFPLLD